MPGFIPFSRGSFMLDLVATAMIIALPVLLYAIRLAKSHRYDTHKRVMLVLSAALFVAVIAFEIEMRLLGWTQFAEVSPYYNTSLPYVLGFHIFCSTITAITLAATVITAVRTFTKPPRPNAFSTTHKRLGKVSAIGLTATSVTGWLFYWMAFIAT